MQTLIFGFLRASFLSFLLLQPTAIWAQVAPEDPTPTEGELEDKPKPAAAPTSESEPISDESESSPSDPAFQKKPPLPEEPINDPTRQPKPIPEAESASPEPILEKPSPLPEEPTIAPQPELTPELDRSEPEPSLAPATPSGSEPTLQPNLTVPQSELTTPNPEPTPEATPTATPEAIPTPAASPRVAPLPSLLSPQQTAPSPGALPLSPQPSPQTSPPVASPSPLNRVPTSSPSPRVTPQLVPSPETPSPSRSWWWIPVGLAALLLAGIPLFLWQKRRVRADAAPPPSEPIPPLSSLDPTGVAGSSQQSVKGNGSLRMNVDLVAVRTKFDPGRQSLKSPASLVDRSANGTIDRSQD